jgi:hypothetical protein
LHVLFCMPCMCVFFPCMPAANILSLATSWFFALSPPCFIACGFCV